MPRYGIHGGSYLELVNINNSCLALFFLPVQSVPQVPVSAVTRGDIPQFVQSVSCLQGGQFYRDMNIYNINY